MRNLNTMGPSYPCRCEHVKLVVDPDEATQMLLECQDCFVYQTVLTLCGTQGCFCGGINLHIGVLPSDVILAYCRDKVTLEVYLASHVDLAIFN